MDIQSDKPVLLEWKFSDQSDLVRTIHTVPLGGALLLQDIGADEFESVTITSGDRLKFVSPEPEQV